MRHDHATLPRSTWVPLTSGVRSQNSEVSRVEPLRGAAVLAGRRPLLDLVAC